MNLQAKYYTPTLQELINHVISGEDVYGLVHELEQVVHFKNEPTLKNLMEFIYSSSNMREDKVQSLPVENFRIKSLDKKDIESLNFIPHDNIRGYFKKGVFVIRFVDSSKEMLIQEYDEYTVDKTIFKGIIKNKLELKKLIEQLQINSNG